MAEENRPAPRGVGRGYSGYDRHGNYDPYGDLLRFREDEDPGARRDEGRAVSRGGYAAWEDFDEAPVARVRSRGGVSAPERATSSGSVTSKASRNALLPQAPAWTAPAALILGPLLGVLAGRTLGSASGPAFAVAAVLAAMLAAAAVPRRTLWWVVPAAPPAIWLTSVAAELILNSSGAQGGANGQMIGLTHATVHAFPVMTAALAAALCVGLAGHVLARADRAPRPDRRGPSHA